jgi:hypothetical protein
MRPYKWITISAAIIITALEAMVFNHETVAAPDTGSVSTTALPAGAIAWNLLRLRGEAVASPSEPGPVNP